jgi:pyridoxal phosphate enzyme (YggS family)
MSLARRLGEVRARIEAACRACGRDPATVELVAVSKTHPAASVREAVAAGQRAFGENRVQEVAKKARELGGVDLAWHMIGSVQTNKVRDLLAVRRLELLHSLDREKLADHLQAELDERGAALPVLLQVNATGEAQKHGVEPERAAELARHVLALAPRLALRGLMAMGPLDGDPAPVFARVASLRERLREDLGLELPVLSLGMTEDLEAAIAAGSTLVRVGSGVFGPRPSRRGV